MIEVDEEEDDNETVAINAWPEPIKGQVYAAAARTSILITIQIPILSSSWNFDCISVLHGHPGRGHAVLKAAPGTALLLA